MAPGVSGKVTLIDCTVYGEIRNFGTAEVIFESGTAEPDTPTEPEKPAIQPSEVYTPGTLLGPHHHLWRKGSAAFTVTGL